MAKVVRIHEFGDPAVLHIEDMEVAAPGEGEVRIAVEAIGINRLEATIRSGQSPMKPPLPAILGTEAVGRIAAAGKGVTGWPVGTRVATLSAASGTYGTYASEILYPAAGLVRLPDVLDSVDWAASWVAFLTAWGGLRDSGGLKAGQTVIITAASSAIGVAAMQIARNLGANVIATTRTPAKIDQLANFGPHHILITEDNDVVGEIRRITGGRGADLIFDPIAGAFAELLMDSLAEEGTLILYGGLSREPTTFPRPLAMRRCLTMRGFNMFSLLSDEDRGPAAIEALRTGIVSGAYRMPVAHRFPLENIADAHRAVERDAHVGKVVVTVQDPDEWPSG